MSEIRLLIVEDEPLIARDISMVLAHNDYTISGIVYSKEDALYELKNNPPDMVLLDINLNGNQEGIDIAREINSKYHLPFVYLTSYSDKQTLRFAKETEPAGYVVKPYSEAGLCATLEIALYNHTQKNRHLYPDLNLEKINRHLELTPLSEREFEVILLIYEGRTNPQIADAIFVSVNTVKKHINNAYLKIDATSRATAIARLRALMGS
jgi:DNA-binding NarL/FixJ family response regulator